jgi:hypothetical protein
MVVRRGVTAVATASWDRQRLAGQPRYWQWCCWADEVLRCCMAEVWGCGRCHASAAQRSPCLQAPVVP